MSSKVNNKVPHTGIHSTGTSFAQVQAKMAIVRRCLLRHFGSCRRKPGSRIETRGLRTFARNFSNIDFFLKILPWKDDELAMSEM